MTVPASLHDRVSDILDEFRPRLQAKRRARLAYLAPRSDQELLEVYLVSQYLQAMAGLVELLRSEAERAEFTPDAGSGAHTLCYELLGQEHRIVLQVPRDHQPGSLLAAPLRLLSDGEVVQEWRGRFPSLLEFDRALAEAVRRGFANAVGEEAEAPAGAEVAALAG